MRKSTAVWLTVFLIFLVVLMPAAPVLTVVLFFVFLAALFTFAMCRAAARADREGHR